ncbi:hypothetical protein FK529_02575 [Tsukamurella asaccharolytica]|uniref:Uncharacterized protein n=1 Tax=Tsukamurella asaccharolytica TaxID=2592067 RepID=A0A5C5RGE0_9ACTN|nr:hypothetical protein [Tsukamurella asaccharolytica]TWS21493.1 hypothetical protein FK529_02575 [Tsukamurella asaccharolytica]
MTNDQHPHSTPPKTHPAEDDTFPATTVEWTAQSGDARRMTLTLVRQRRLWLRALTTGLIVGIIATAICVATGSGWPLGLAIGGGFSIGVALEMMLVWLISAYRHNRIGLAPGARWALGSDAVRLRIDNPINTFFIERANIVSIDRTRPLSVVTVRPKRRLGIPAELLDSWIDDPSSSSYPID